MRILALSALYLLSSALAYVTTRAAIRAEFPAYNWTEQGVEVSASLIRHCESFCIVGKELLYTISPIACTCTGGRWTRF